VKAKDVIIGDPHRLGFDEVIVEDLVRGGEGKEPNEWTAIVRCVDGERAGETFEVSARQLGPISDPIEHRIRADELMQPHRADAFAHAAKAREAGRLRGRHRGSEANERDRWARHRFSEFQCVVPGPQAAADKRTAFEFGHALEYDLALALDRAGIAWSPEPVRFALSRSAFQPDFHLPEYELFIEVTQDDAAIKSEKLEALAIHHPGVEVIVLTRPDIQMIQRMDADTLRAFLASWRVREERPSRWRQQWRRRMQLTGAP
jgi:hypothetical protein